MAISMLHPPAMTRHSIGLRAYGEARGMAFDDRNRLLRTTGPFERLQCGSISA